MRDRLYWARLLAFVTGLVNQELLIRNTPSCMAVSGLAMFRRALAASCVALGIDYLDVGTYTEQLRVDTQLASRTVESWIRRDYLPLEVGTRDRELDSVRAIQHYAQVLVHDRGK
jgi:hypothetical protein